MIRVDVGDAIFNYRVAGLAVNGDRVMLHRAEVDDFWSLPGGRVHALETAPQALAREMREELEVDVRVDRLLWAADSFFAFGGRRYHELGLYFLMALPDESLLYGETAVFEGEEDSGLKLYFKWQPVDTLGNLTILPPFLQTELRSLPQEAQYVDDTRGGGTLSDGSRD